MHWVSAEVDVMRLFSGFLLDRRRLLLLKVLLRGAIDVLDGMSAEARTSAERGGLRSRRVMRATPQFNHSNHVMHW